MDDVLRYVVLTPGDENLGAVNAVVLALRHGARAHCRQVRSCLRFRQIHGSGPFSRHQIGQEGVFLQIRPMPHQRGDHSGGQHRTQTKSHIG